MTTIDNTNYELWLLRYAEGGLTDAERREVEQWLQAHPAEAGELQLYAEAPRLAADPAVHYGGTLPGRTRSLWPAALQWTAAAAVVVALMVPAALTVTTPERLPRQVAQVQEEPTAEPAEPEVARPARPHRAAARPKPAPQAAEPKVLPVAVEEYVAETLPEPTVLPIAEYTADTTVASPEAEPVAAPQEPVYADFLFSVEPLGEGEQMVLALNDAAQDALQDSYLGRRLARRLPTDTELVDRMRDLRENTPTLLRMAGDMISTIRKTNN